MIAVDPYTTNSTAFIPTLSSSGNIYCEFVTEVKKSKEANDWENKPVSE